MTIFIVTIVVISVLSILSKLRMLKTGKFMVYNATGAVMDIVFSLTLLIWGLIVVCLS